MGGIVGSIVGSVGSNLASSALSGGADDASSAYAAQIAKANQAVMDATTRSRASYMPYRQAGLQALNSYYDLMNIKRPTLGFQAIEDAYNSHSSAPIDYTAGSGGTGGNSTTGSAGEGFGNANNGLTQFFSTPEYQLLWGNSGASVDPNASPTDRFMANPAYQSGLKLANQALEASAAAKGNALSGNQLKAVSQLNTDYGNQYFNQYQTNLGNTFGDYANRLASLAGYGLQSANGAATNSDLPQAQMLSQNYTNLGDTMANSALASANARASGYTNTTNSLLGSGVSKFSDIGKGISSFFS